MVVPPPRPLFPLSPSPAFCESINNIVIRQTPLAESSSHLASSGKRVSSVRRRKKKEKKRKGEKEEERERKKLVLPRRRNYLNVPRSSGCSLISDEFYGLSTSRYQHRELRPSWLFVHRIEPRSVDNLDVVSLLFLSLSLSLSLWNVWNNSPSHVSSVKRAILSEFRRNWFRDGTPRISFRIS